MKFPVLIPAVALAFGLAACDAGQSSGTEMSRLTADAEAVKKLENAYIAAWRDKDPAVVGFYAPDAVLMTPNAPPRRGLPSINESFVRYAANPAAKFDATTAATVISEGGDLAYSQGTYTMSVPNPQTKAIEDAKGYYLLVYKKQPDGSWKIVQDVSSPLP